jgi:DNA-directed RNA polymerase specialized sigma24 family protein
MYDLAGASQSLPSMILPPLPTGKRFYGAIIDILGEQTDYRSQVGVKATLDGVIKPVLRASGIDPDTNEHVLSGHWPLCNNPEKKDLHRKVGFGFRNQRAGNCPKSQEPLTVQIKPNVWGLTEAGVDEAVRRRRVNDPTWAPAWQENITSTWLDDNEQELAREMFSAARHLSIEAEPEDILLHLRHQRERDGLRLILSSGDTPSALDLLLAVHPVEAGSLDLPKPTPLFDPLIDLLCDLTSFQANVGVTPDDSLVELALLNAGIDAKTHPLVMAGAWAFHGKPSLTRQVQHAMKWQADTRKGTCCGAKLYDATTCPSCGKVPILAHSSSRCFTTFLREPGKRPQWALTPAGVEHGMLRRCGGEALTPFWLSQHPEAISGLEPTLRKHNRRLSADKAKELCSAFLDDLHSKDGLRDLIVNGASPTVETVYQMCLVYAEARWKTRNATTEWLAEDVDRILATIRKQLGGALAKSRNIGEIDDLAHNYLADIMSNDTLATRLAEGHAPTKWTLASWARLRAYSKFRDAGRDAHSRAFREANTAVERGPEDVADIDMAKIHDAIVEISLPTEATPIHLATNREGRQDFVAGSGSGSSALVDVMDDLDPEERMICALDRERGLARLEQCVKTQKKGAPERYWGVYKAVAHEGLSTKEIAEREGVQRNRAASLTQDMRTALRSSLSDSQRALDILQYVKEEPYATERDIHEDLGLQFTDIVRIVGALKNSGWLEAEFMKATKRAEGSYTITRRGSALIREQADPELRTDLMSRLVV